ncbi:MAG: sigma-54-dependent Fis family transcriptional regulator, partial [Alphaproteobacteria bacterium]|nr:sigma-54-dependent Fis family transcriptional regulator [Alphaproteobacteria bacterium]
IPPLANRRDDIIPLSQYFMQRLAHNMNLEVKPFSDQAAALLMQHEWLGNARELRNLIERLLILLPWRDLKEIPAEAIVQLLGGQVSALNDNTAKADNGLTPIWSLPYRQAKAQFERDYLLRQLKLHHGNIARTAANVGIERTALHRKLKTYDIRDN